MGSERNAITIQRAYSQSGMGLFGVVGFLMGLDMIVGVNFADCLVSIMVHYMHLSVVITLLVLGRSVDPILLQSPFDRFTFATHCPAREWREDLLPLLCRVDSVNRNRTSLS